MKRYEEYTLTGVEWMPEIPAEWEVKKLKSFIEDLESGVSVNSFDEPIIGKEVGILKTSCVYSYKFEQIENKKVLAEEVDKVRVSVRGNSLIISRMNTPELVGASGYVSADIPNLFLPDRLWQTAFRKDIPFSCFPKWLSYVFISAPFRMLITSLATGTSPSMKNISKEEVLNIQVGFPTHSEQEAIAQFLDNKTAQIDKLITQKRQMLELLWEERAALINHAVTKGLDTAAPLRDSGVEWLGEVPAHWEVKRLKWIAKIQGGIALSASKKLENPVTLPYLRVANVQDGYLDLAEVKVVEVEADQVARYTLRKGDLLMNEGGDNDKLGRGCIWKGEVEPCLHQNHVFAVRLFDSYDPEWLNLITTTEGAKIHFMTRAKQSTNLASISSSNIKELPVLLPPADEQQQIIKFVAAEGAQIAEVTSTINQEITLLQEYRAALIAEAVTGQIDVRHYEPATLEVSM